MRRRAGFTLIEILVVIAIISTILGGVALMVNQAVKSRMKHAAEGRVQSLGGAISMLESSDNLDMAPPTRLEELLGPGGAVVGKKLGSGGNETNRGIETVYVALRLQGINVSVDGFDDEGAMGNLDGDSATETTGKMPSAELWEYLDPWGNPLVYISNRDYKKMKGVERYLLGNGQEVKVAPLTTATGEFARPSSFQLFSLGPDGVPGTEDDIVFNKQ